MQGVTTPLNVDHYAELLTQTGYDKEKSEFLINGFRNGFSLNYQGPKIRTDEARNIPFTIGNSREMWRKIMKEVRLERLAGPYSRPPFENYVKSPIGLVPKDGGLQTRLIFHLSFDFPSGNSSVNSSTPEELCSVKYNDLDTAIKYCLQMIESEKTKTGVTPNLYFSKTDLRECFLHSAGNPAGLLAINSQGPPSFDWRTLLFCG